MASESGGRKSEAFEISPVRDGMPFGAVVTNLELAALAVEQVRRDLRRLWIEAGVIVFKGLTGKAAQIALSEVFGELMPHPVKEVQTEDRLLVNIPYRPDAGLIVEVGGEMRGLAQAWHSDLIYAPTVNRGGVLRPVELPTRWGETGFIDQVWAYDTLPAPLKAKIEGLHVVYQYNVDPSLQKFGVTNPMKFVRMTPLHASIQARLDEFPQVIHPLVFTQAETGRKVLNLSPWFSVGIYEFPGADGDQLLEEVARHIVDGGHEYIHRWAMDEMVLFDNWRMLHSGFGSPVDESRIMQRTNIAGDYGLGRVKPSDEDRGRRDYAIV